MRIKNREQIFASARLLSPDLGNLAQNDIDLTDEDVGMELVLCEALIEAIQNYAHYINCRKNYNTIAPKDLH